MRALLFLLSLMWDLWSTHCNPTFLCPTNCICHLELHLATCAGANLTDLPAALPPYMEHLNFSFNKLAYIHRQTFRSMRHLRTLLLNDNRIGGVADGAFAPLEALLRLDLSRNNISRLAGGFSLGLGSLRELSLADNRLSGVDAGCFAHLDALLRLDLRGNGIRSLAARTFGAVSTLRYIRLDRNVISSLADGIFSTLRNLEQLGLRGNEIEHLDAGVFAPLTSLAVLDLADNKLKKVDFKALLSVQAQSTHVLLEGNPWTCNCDLQRVFQKLHSVRRLLLDDYDDLTCRQPQELQGHSLRQVDTGLCFAETVTVLIITITVVITVVAAIVMAEKSREKRNKGRHWTEVSEMSFDSQD
ncbi:leucine-rich repeat-containing protein 38 [Electrophorus electricus]|nr:leucine-rich repeat-containing protein 38 [Electrophorus electricus]